MVGGLVFVGFGFGYTESEIVGNCLWVLYGPHSRLLSFHHVGGVPAKDIFSGLRQTSLDRAETLQASCRHTYKHEYTITD